MGEPGTKEVLSLEELEASVGLRTGRKHILSILVENKPGVLTRIAGLFARRGFNIDTLAVGPTDDPTLSRITLTLDGAMHPIDQVTKQLHKLVNVIKIRDLEPTETVARELALFKVSADGASRAEVMQMVEIFRGKIIDVSKRSVIVEVTGSWDKIEAFERMVRPFGLIEMARTGEIAISRGRGRNLTRAVALDQVVEGADQRAELLRELARVGGHLVAAVGEAVGDRRPGVGGSLTASSSSVRPAAEMPSDSDASSAAVRVAERLPERVLTDAAPSGWTVILSSRKASPPITSYLIASERPAAGVDELEAGSSSLPQPGATTASRASRARRSSIVIPTLRPGSRSITQHPSCSGACQVPSSPTTAKASSTASETEPRP